MGRFQSSRACVSRGTVPTGKGPCRGRPPTARVFWPCVSQAVGVSHAVRWAQREPTQIDKWFNMRRDGTVGGSLLRGVVKLRGNRGRELKEELDRCVNRQGSRRGTSFTRIGMCKWPTFCNPQLLLANARSCSSSVIGRRRSPTICPDDMSFSSSSDDLRFFESRVLRLEIRRVASPVILPAKSQLPRRIRRTF